MSDDVTEGARWAPPEGYEVLEWRRGFGHRVGPLYNRTVPDDRSTMAMLVQEHHTNGMRNVHGGMLMTLADMAWGNLVAVERSVFWVTVRLTCDFLSAAKLGDWVEAGGELMAVEDDVFSVRGRVWVAERTLVTGVGVFKAVAPRDPRPGEKAFPRVGVPA